jgi:hypothetical protein
VILVDAALRQEGGARQIDPTQHGCAIENRATEASVLLEPWVPQPPQNTINTKSTARTLAPLPALRHS